MNFKRVLVGLACASIGISILKVISPYGVALNYTQSIPRGLYFKVDYPAPGLSRGKLACFYYKAPPWAVERKYAAPNQEFCKPVVGLPGDSIEIAGRTLTVHQTRGRLVRAPLQANDSKGRPLPIALNSGVIPPGKILFLTELVPNSLDSRYIGLIDIKQVSHLAYPLITE